MVERKPVVVVGAGIAGVTAAWTLHRRGEHVVLIERSGRVGGRMQTEWQHGCGFESGMQFYYGAYRETLRLLRAVGLSERLVPAQLSGFMTYGGGVAAFDKSMPWLGLLGARD